MTPSKPVVKYLSRYAEKEAVELAENFTPLTAYGACIVIPLYAEKDWLEAPLTTLKHASAQLAPLRTLAILVLNHHDKSTPKVITANQSLLSQLKQFPHQRINSALFHFIITIDPTLDLLVLDHTGAEQIFSEKEGVGIARKLGMDTALALWQRHHLTCRHFHTSDGDALLARDYFTSILEDNADILLHPFRHEGDYAQSQALTLYEMSLRYYVLGLYFARSPYAFHTIGSTIAITPQCYASVRGFPKRNAAEDFYLLNKAAKTGKVLRKTTGEVVLIGRESDRVPFGTGTGTQKFWDTLILGDAIQFYHPNIFCLLKFWLAEIESYSKHGNLMQSRASLKEQIAFSFGADVASAFDLTLLQTGCYAILQTAAETRSSPEAISRHSQESFDAFRTLKLVHALRDHIFPNLEWLRCLRTAPFLREVFTATWAADETFAESPKEVKGLLQAMAREEVRLCESGSLERHSPNP